MSHADIKSEPSLVTPKALLADLEELKSLEPIIYAANDGKTRDYFEQLLAPEFWEVAASGKRYSRSFVLDTLEKRQLHPFEQDWVTKNHYLQKLTQDLFLITYDLQQPMRLSARTSLWRKTTSGWQFVYHHGATVF